MSEDAPKKPNLTTDSGLGGAPNREWRLRHEIMPPPLGRSCGDRAHTPVLGGTIPGPTPLRGPIVPIYPDYESDFPFVDNSRAVPTSNGEDVPTPRHLLPIAPKPAVNLGELEFDDVTEGMVRKTAARLVKLWMEQANHEGIVAIPPKELIVGGSVLYGEDGPMSTPISEIPADVRYFKRGTRKHGRMSYPDQVDMADPWIDIPKSRPVIDSEDMKELHQLMGYNCDPASAHEQKLYMTFGVATIPFRK